MKLPNHGPNLIDQEEVISNGFRKGEEENGDVQENGVGLDSASGVCDRRWFLNRLEGYPAWKSDLLEDADNHSPRIVFSGAMIRTVSCMTQGLLIGYFFSSHTSGNVKSPGIRMGGIVG